jgi:Rhodopirellula transposase DDE domain
MKTKAYTQEIEAQMLNFYNSLSEKDRRRYAAIEATKLGYGGDTYIRRILHCDDRTIARGKQELITPLSDEGPRIRKRGGGRKFVIDEMKGLDEAFLDVLKNHTAGSPMDEAIKWTNMSRHAIVEKLKEQGFTVSTTVIDQLLRKHNFRPRKAFKTEAGKKNIPQRDEQFKNIERLKKEYTDAGNPVLSMDVKKKN